MRTLLARLKVFHYFLRNIIKVYFFFNSEIKMEILIGFEKNKQTIFFKETLKFEPNFIRRFCFKKRNFGF